MTLPVIFGIAGPELRPEEQALFREFNPFGFILFARNLDTPTQTVGLVKALREAAGAEAPVLIDQEGGRVQRFGPPHAPAYPPAAVYGQLATSDLARAGETVRIGHALLGRDLAGLGIDVNCAPVLDLAMEEGHAVIGDRAFAGDPRVVAALGRAAMDGLGRAGVLPVVKHIPGHGRARADSHKQLPVVETPRQVLEATDFVPFRVLRDAPVAMTAHVVYAALDADLPVTVSAKAIREVVRGRIGFEGLLLSDDLCMGALAGAMEQRACAALAAGCDVVLHCSGNIDEMTAVARAVPVMTDEASARWRLAQAWLAARREPEQVRSLEYRSFGERLPHG
ncbi:MAG: beta-N-acetylhexosaminidase [Rhodospirillales bacterium]|nr:beta-N-acetylhexosaminidase [Rhodospirillales bacterium]